MKTTEFVSNQSLDYGTEDLRIIVVYASEIG